MQRTADRRRWSLVSSTAHLDMGHALYLPKEGFDSPLRRPRSRPRKARQL